MLDSTFQKLGVVQDCLGIRLAIFTISEQTTLPSDCYVVRVHYSKSQHGPPSGQCEQSSSEYAKL